MKQIKQIGTFAAGMALGVGLMLSIAAVNKPQNETKPVGPLSLIGYVSGATGIFDASSNTIYLYDSNLQRCFSIRQITELGAPMRVIR